MVENNKNHEHTSEPMHLDSKKFQTPALEGMNVEVSSAEQKKKDEEMQKLRKKIDNLKKFIQGKYKFVEAMGIIPPQAAEIFDEENDLNPEERKEKPLHLLVVLSDDKEKEYNDVKMAILKEIQKEKLKVWLNLFLERDLWEIALDSKYQIIEAIGMALPLFDKGILGALRVCQIHKSMVLKKFEKYVYSYVIGGSLVRGEIQKTSDVDVYIIIDDTDIKRMSRLELKDKLRGIINSYVMRAGEMAGVKNKLSTQVYLLTEFWEGVKDANPIFYTFLRDGVPLYDRGGFLPWKLLLKMGKIKPSPESIDMFMGMGEKTQEIAKRKMLDIVIGDIYWGVITPSQGMLMLYGLPPTNPKETVNEMKRIFVDEEKMLEQKYADILEEIVIKYYKGYEHQKIKEVSGKEIDKLLKNSKDYLKRLKELREELEKRMTEKTFQEIYENVFKLLKSLFGKKAESSLIKEYEKEIVNRGKGNPKFLHTLNNLILMKKKFKTKKPPSKYDFEKLRKDSVYLIQETIEYGQRKELGLLQKIKVVITYNEKGKDKHADLFLTKPAFLASDEGKKIMKIEKGKVKKSSSDEMNQILTDYKGNRVVLDSETMNALKKELGEFSVSL